MSSAVLASESSASRPRLKDTGRLDDLGFWPVFGGGVCENGLHKACSGCLTQCAPSTVTPEMHWPVWAEFDWRFADPLTVFRSGNYVGISMIAYTRGS